MSYEKNIVDIKNEYTNFFINMVAPLVHEGIKSIYNRALDLEKQYDEASKKMTVVNNPGVLKIFQHFLKGVPNLNVNLIEAEMIRIRDSSKNADIFDKLIKAVIKSNIILLTFNASGKTCKLVREKIHERIDPKMFIHKIYIECAKNFYANPELFWHKFQTIEIQRNQRDAINIIKDSIKEAIIKTLPLDDILSEYLNNEYVEEDEDYERQKVRNMLLDEDKPINLYDENQPLINPDENGHSEYNHDEEKKLLNELNANIDNMDALIKKDENKEENRVNSEAEYNARKADPNFTFDLANKNKKTTKEPSKNLSDEIPIVKSNIKEDKIGFKDINPEEYYKTMFV